MIYQKTFNCIDGCGECCRYINKVEGLKHLQNGDGVCIYLKDNKCTIYNNRPDLCNFNKLFEMNKNKITFEEYDRLSVYYCNYFQSIKKN